MFHGKHQAGHHHPASGPRPPRRLRPGARRGPQGSRRPDAPLVGRGPAADGRRTAAARDGRHTTGRAGRRAVLADGHLRLRPQLLRPHGPGRTSAPGPSTRCPTFSSDRARHQARSNGDLWVQIGADDALVAFHALRAIQKEAGARRQGALADERLQPRPRRHGPADDRPQPDGPDRRHQQPEAVREPTSTGGSSSRRTGDGAADWMARRLLRRRTAHPDAARRLGEALRWSAQEKVIGRRKSDGAPLSGGTETTDDGPRQGGTPTASSLIPANAHARIARPEPNGGAAMLRRPFSYHDGFGARRRAGRRAAVRLLAGGPAARVRAGAAQARPGRRAVAVHPARGERPVRGAGRRGGRASTWGSGCWRREGPRGALG